MTRSVRHILINEYKLVTFSSFSTRTVHSTPEKHKENNRKEIKMIDVIQQLAARHL